MEIFIITLSVTLCVYLGVYLFTKYFGKDEDVFATLKDIKSVEPTTFACEDCKCEIKEENAYKVKFNQNKFNDWFTQIIIDDPKYADGVSYYCQRCKPKFSRIFFGNNKIVYYKELEELEVTKDGEPVGYKKK